MLQRVSPREREVLAALWDLGPSTVREVLEQLRRGSPELAYSTVKTFLHRLEEKGAVVCDRSGFAHVFSPAESPEEQAVREVEALAARAGASTFPVVRALVQKARLTQQELDELASLVRALGAEEEEG